MSLVNHLAIFFLSLSVLWFFSGTLLDSVGRLAARFCRSGFGTAFFILGFLTSISEISVAINAGIAGTPEVSAGNLVGASFVILLFIVPFLAVAGNGMSIKGLVSKETLAFTLLVILFPIFLLADGRVTMLEGGFALLAYLALAYSMQNKPEGNISNVCIPERLGNSKEFYIDVVKILVGATAVFIASHFLVVESIAVATYLSIPASLLGLLLLSIGTNIPEMVIAIRAVLARKKDIAFGDYLGSAAANVAIFGGLAMFTGGFAVEQSEFSVTALLALGGFALFYFFARSHAKLTRREGTVLLFFYGAFVLIQLVNIIRFSAE